MKRISFVFILSFQAALIVIYVIINTEDRTVRSDCGLLVVDAAGMLSGNKRPKT